jgi:hypothetical protein
VLDTTRCKQTILVKTTYSKHMKHIFSPSSSILWWLNLIVIATNIISLSLAPWLLGDTILPNGREWVGDWLLFSVKWAICQLYHGKIKLHSDEMMIMSAFSYMSCWMFAVLPHWDNNARRIYMLLHSDTLVWFRVNQSLLLLLNAAWLAEKKQIPVL